MVTTTDAIVFVVDDDARVRRAVARLIRSVGIEAETFASAHEFLQAYSDGRPGCLVLDVRMPGLSGLELQQQLVSTDAGLPIIFISGHGDIPMSVRAMKHGAIDFLEKPFNDQKLLDAIHVALERNQAERRARSERAVVLERVATLTPRERQVLRLVVAGRPNKQIAAELGTSEQTIKVHRGRVMTKMGADSLAELVVLAQLAGIDTTKVSS